MADDAELKLMARIEASQKLFERQMRSISKSAGVEFQKMSNSGKAFEKNMVRVSNNIRNVFAGAFASLGAANVVNQIFQVNKTFQDLESSLKTATGSLQGAKDAFKSIQDLAVKTPYSVSGLTESFVLLKNLGIEPTMRRMTAFGNISSAMNKSFKQMAEAVADAATGEFERLKEFGIKASQEGEKVKLTFRGVTQTIGNNAQEITNYLQKLGEAEFGGAMASKMQNLSGLMANLGDKVDNFYLKIGEAGATSIFGEAIQAASNAVDLLTNNLDNLGVAASGLAVTLTAAVLPALAKVGIALAGFAASPFGAMILGAGVLAGALVKLYNTFSDLKSASDNLKDAQNLVTQSAVIAARAQNGLTVSLQKQGLQAASTAKELAQLAKAQANARLGKIGARLDELKMPDGSGKFKPGKAIAIQVGALKKQQAAVEEQWQLSSARLSDAIAHYDKISKAKIVTEINVDLTPPDVDLGSAINNASKSVSSKVAQLFESTRTPLEKLKTRMKELEDLSRRGKITNDLFNRGIAQARADYKAETEKPSKGGSKGGGTAKGAASAVNSWIEKNGSAADRARLATLNYNNEMKKLNEALRTGKIDQETYNNSVERVKSVYEQAKAAAKDYSQVTATIMDEVKGTLKGAFSEIFKNGKLTMKGLLDMVNNMMSRIFDKVMGLAIDGIFASFGWGGKAPVARRDGGIVQAFASGGHVRGAGTGRSDSIPAMLSNGEYVINASATKRYRGLLDTINSGNRIAVAKQSAVNQNINVSQQPVVNVNLNVINRNPERVSVRQTNDGFEVDLIRQVESGLKDLIDNDESALMPSIRSKMG